MKIITINQLLICFFLIFNQPGYSSVLANDKKIPQVSRTDNFYNWKTEFKKLTNYLITQDKNIVQGNLPISHSLDSTLGIDYVFIPATKNKTNLIIFNSGIHGVEAAAGVYMQHYFMRFCIYASSKACPFDRSNTAVLIIHVMNPYGAKYKRRFNGNNVDLNRNCFDDQSSLLRGFPGVSIQNKEYEDLRNTLENLTSQFKIIYTALIKGSNTIQKALSGQYQYPFGIYYGGEKVEAECASVQQLLSLIIPEYKNIALVDVHTGLGKYGINQVMIQPLENSASLRERNAYLRENNTLKMMFPPDECKNLCEVQDPANEPFITTGDFTQWLYQKYPEKRIKATVLSFTAEIGTTSSRHVLQALINENYCYWNREECGNEKYQQYREKLEGVFRPSDEDWSLQLQKIAIQMGMALSRFSTLK